MDLKTRLQQSLSGSYTLERELGGGGMSRVFVAEDASLGRQIVIKVLAPELAEGLSADRFKREIQVAARLQHPNIVPLLSAGDAAGLPFYTMPMVEGESLRARLEKRGELPVREAVSVLRDVARALTYAHTQGVVHRDVKPDNVLVGGDYAVVTDFGVAKAITEARSGVESSTLTGLGTALGTPAYMAPEQATGDPGMDHRADIYAFGILAYELLVGEPPFTGRSMQAVLAAHATERPTPISSRRPAVPAPLAELIMMCLEKRPADRPQSTEDVVRALDAVAALLDSGERLSSTPATLASHQRVPISRRMVFAGAAALLGLLAIAALMFLPRVRDDASLDQNLIVVAPFRVTSSDPSVRGLREGMADLVGMKLTGSLRPVDPRAVLAAWRKAGGSETNDPERRHLVTIARELGAARVLEGTVLHTPQGLEVSGTLFDVRRPESGVTTRVSGAPTAITSLVDTLVAKLLVLDAGEKEAVAMTLAQIPWPAVQQFLLGQAAYRRGHYIEATEAYGRALAIDTTFALAGYQLWLSDGWSLTGAGARGLSAARTHRDRLDSLAKIIVSMPGEGATARSCVETLQAREAAAAFAPDVPEVWYLVGDHLFHCGPQMGMVDAWQRSLASFNRALAIDSGYAPAAEHMPFLHLALGDTAMALRSLALTDSAGDFAILNRYWVLRDAEPVMRRIDRQSTTYAAFAALFAGWLGDYATGDTFIARGKARVVTAEERKSMAEVEYYYLMDRGFPTRAASVGANRRSPPEMVLDALLWDGDTTVAAEALRLVLATADRPPPQGEDDREWVHSQFVAGLYAMDRGQSADAARRLATLAAHHARTRSASTPAGKLAILLEARIATAEGRPNARAALHSADSMLLRGEPEWELVEPAGNLLVARMWERLGDQRRALAAARRFRNGPELWPYSATRTRETARLAAAVGERDEAIREYQAYLRLRGEPEPRLVVDRDNARRDLDRLIRAGQ
jgi:eukaryotic-like serine/threonine-protein kinase